MNAPKDDATFECGAEFFRVQFRTADHGEAYLGIFCKVLDFFADAFCPVEPNVLSVVGVAQRNAVRVAEGILRGEDAVFAGL